MSQTESFGVSDASRWTGVSASLVEYLTAWLASEQEAPPIPRGIFAGGRRFLNHALEGIALNRHQRQQPQVPIMAGISNLTIALEVFTRLAVPAGGLDQVEQVLRDYVTGLDEIEEKRPRNETLIRRAEKLRSFFQELLDRGNRARHAALARSESPRP